MWIAVVTYNKHILLRVWIIPALLYIMRGGNSFFRLIIGVSGIVSEILVNKEEVTPSRNSVDTTKVGQIVVNMVVSMV